jgi:hypothetical protein
VGAGWFRGGGVPGLGGPCHTVAHTGRSHWLGGALHYCIIAGLAHDEGHRRAPFDLLAGFAQGPQSSAKCQCSLLAGFAQGLQSHAIRPQICADAWWPTNLRVPSALLARHFHCSLSWSLLCNPPSRRSSRRATTVCPHAITPTPCFPPPVPRPSSSSLRSRAAVLIGHWSRSSRWPFESDKVTKKRRGSSIQSSI